MVPCSFPLRLNVPTQIWIDFDDENSELLQNDKYRCRTQCSILTVWSARLPHSHELDQTSERVSDPPIYPLRTESGKSSSPVVVKTY